jgi:hypothetical protein
MKLQIWLCSRSQARSMQSSRSISTSFLLIRKIKAFDLCNHFVEKFSCELIRVLIRYIEVKRIHRQSHRCMCDHWKFTHIHIRFISISFFVCSRSNHDRFLSECFWTVMKTWIDSNKWVSFTQWNNSTKIFCVKYITSSKFWLSFSYHKTDFESQLVQLICDILCVFHIHWSVWFVCSNLILNRTSERLKQDLRLVCVSERVLNLFVFCKKQYRIICFFKS